LKLLTILGARPQFVKAAMVSRAIIALDQNHQNRRIQEVIVHTGQHYDANMSDVFFEQMRIPPPYYHLGVGGCSHGAMTGRMLEQIETVILKEKPGIVLVYGDTNSTLAGALAAVKLSIPVAHVEAGLRSYNRNMPEEINRILADHVSHWLFCPTATAVKNLAKEGIVNHSPSSSKAPIVMNVGDVMYDAALFYRRIAAPTDAIKQLILELGKGFYLATIHRAKNTDNLERLRNIVEALNVISKFTPILLPLHPRTRKLMAEDQIYLDSVKCFDPVGYFDMLALLENCKAVFTDSGGVQKEAYFFRKPCITLRDETEWVELVEHGFNKLAGAKRDHIIAAEKNMDSFNNDYSLALYGTGEAANKIIRVLLDSAL
jgi:UDP-GlcNAc3NAcA epimerase